ncbi:MULTISPECIES: hypothetical protein [unclassified Nostoc]|nr:hypothetical protein [Nostoc sp. JL34]
MKRHSNERTYFQLGVTYRIHASVCLSHLMTVSPARSQCHN